MNKGVLYNILPDVRAFTRVFNGNGVKMKLEFGNSGEPFVRYRPKFSSDYFVASTPSSGNSVSVRVEADFEDKGAFPHPNVNAVNGVISEPGMTNVWHLDLMSHAYYYVHILDCGNSQRQYCERKLVRYRHVRPAETRFLSEPTPSPIR